MRRVVLLVVSGLLLGALLTGLAGALPGSQGLPISRHDHRNMVSDVRQRARQRAAYIGQAPGLGKRQGFAGGHQDAGGDGGRYGVLAWLERLGVNSQHGEHFIPNAYTKFLIGRA